MVAQVVQHMTGQRHRELVVSFVLSDMQTHHNTLVYRAISSCVMMQRGRQMVAWVRGTQQRELRHRLRKRGKAKD